MSGVRKIWIGVAVCVGGVIYGLEDDPYGEFAGASSIDLGSRFDNMLGSVIKLMTGRIYFFSACLALAVVGYLFMANKDNREIKQRLWKIGASIVLIGLGPAILAGVGVISSGAIF